jgi:hypothetical protein
MKTLFSFMVEKDTIKKIKAIEGTTIAEFAREALEYYLENKSNRYLKISKPIESMLYELQNGLPISIDDYSDLFATLDSYYSCGVHITNISDEETVLLAFCAAELLQLEFCKKNISQHAERYFANYFLSDRKYTTILDKVNFLGLVTFLYFEIGQARFDTLGLIRIIGVFLRDKLTLGMEARAYPYLKKLNFILIKLTKHLLMGDNTKSYSGVKNLLEKVEPEPIKITEEDRNKFEFRFSDDDFYFHGSLYVIDGTAGRFYVEVKGQSAGYATMSLAQWTELIEFLKDEYYRPTKFLFVKDRNDFMMEWRYPFMVGDLDKFKQFIFKLLETPEYKKLTQFVYGLENHSSTD